MLTATELTKEFGNLLAVDSVDFSVDEGTITAIIGPNGAGKTTFFNLLSGRLTPTTGTVRFLGKDITEDPPYKRCAAGIGRSFQINNIFPDLTVLENVRAPAQATLDRQWTFWRHRDEYEDVREQAIAALRNVGLEGQTNQRASDLPYGDQRRLEIAITIATDPDLILLDEPTAGMSPEETERTIELIEQLNSDFTIILIEHDMDVVDDVSDRIMVLNQGRKLLEGQPSEVLNDEQVQKAYLGGP
jgi:branched-chain amino acid transport system ATP-binding protein